MGTNKAYSQRDFAMLGMDEARMWELELHANGGLLACSRELELCPGDGLSVVLHLSSGAPIRINARVRCLRLLNEEGTLAAWIEYTDLSAFERREFLRWQANIKRGTGSNRVCVEVEHKYQVRRCAGALSVRIHGQLEAGEAKALAHTVMSRVEADSLDMLALLIDVSGLEPFAEEALRSTRRWLRYLVRARASLGILVGESSAGFVQLRRVLREVGLDELLVNFSSREDAMPSWEQLLEQVAGRGLSAWREESLCA